MTFAKKLRASVSCALGVALTVVFGLPPLGWLLGTTTFEGWLASGVLFGVLIVGAFVGLTIDDWWDRVDAWMKRKGWAS